jgi:HPt (histidine-containing phosphotransfer) domain-containing protein
MTDIPILDCVRLDLITRGSAKLADEFLVALFEEADGLLDRLGALLANGNRVAVTDAAHTIKGIAGELGAMRLRAAAAALEAEGLPARWPDGVKRVHDALVELRSFDRSA